MEMLFLDKALVSGEVEIFDCAVEHQQRRAESVVVLDEKGRRILD